MTTAKSLLTRASASKLVPPTPTPDQLDHIVQIAMRAPDHGALRPWRFLVIEGAGLVRLADLGAAALAHRQPASTDADLDRAREKLVRAPMVIALGGRIDRAHPKIPEVEQILSVGAAGMNLLNALHALDFAGKWVTGANVYDPFFAEGLGFEPPERCFGLFMVGTSERESRPMMHDIGNFVRRWE